jgi:nicotinate-nucleotide pyrophosphorylase (carboxylating)
MTDQVSLALVRRALAEDLAGFGDVTSAWTVPADLQGQAEIIAREDLVVCGVPLAALVMREIDPEAEFSALACDGTALGPRERVAVIQGSVRGILSAERTMLNFLSHLSGVATEARRFAAAVEGLQAKVVDTRKTTPGLRAWEKRAVVLGGCRNHRFGLYDMVLIKNNHLTAAGGVREAVRRAKEVCPHTMKIEVEVENADDLREAIAA